MEFDQADASLSEARGKSLAEMAYDLILDRLLRRQIPTGTVLQEQRLADSLDISRTPVREALNRLESEGFVKRAGRVLLVKEFSARELIETLSVRQVLETETMSLAAERLAPLNLDAVEADIHALLAGPVPSVEEDWAVDCRFHDMVAEGSGNTLLAQLVADLRRKTYMFNLDRVPERFRVGHIEHLEMIDALRRRDRAAACAGIRAHIGNVKESIIRSLSAI